MTDFSSQQKAPKGYSLLYSRQDIQNRASEIIQDFANTLEDVVPVVVLGGAMEWSSVVLPELYRKGLDTERYFIQAKSYHGTESGECVVQLVTPGLGEALRGQTVLLIEDIVDTGNTVAAIASELSDFGARRIVVLSMLNKPSKRNPDIDLSGVEILSAFEIPGDYFVVGFGLDLDGKYRHFPGVCIPE